MDDTTPERTTWYIKLSNGQPLVASVYVSYVAALDEYVCSVLAGGGVRHFSSKDDKQAYDAARYATESTFGEILLERPRTKPDEVRICRWNGGALLLSEDEGIHLEEAELQTIMACSGAAQVIDYLVRRVMPKRHTKQQDIFKAWVANKSKRWERLRIDAFFAAHSTADYLNDD